MAVIIFIKIEKTLYICRNITTLLNAEQQQTVYT